MHIDFQDAAVELISGRTLRFSGNVELKPGTVTLVVGDNGAGKSTFLALMQTIAERQASSHIHHVDFSHIRTDFANIRACTVFQEPRQNFICRTSADEVILPLLDRDNPALTIIDRIADLADAADVYSTQLWDRRIDDLSSGEQQKIAICAALAPRPQLMLWDEALARVDDKSFQRIVTLVTTTLGDGVVLAATHRPQRHLRFFQDAITSVIRLTLVDNVISVVQEPIVPGDGCSLVGDDEDINFAERSLWQQHVSEVDGVKKLFSNGFRLFAGRGDALVSFENLEFMSRGTIIARLRSGTIAEPVNFVVGRNASGKTLFLQMLAGNIPINPFWRGTRLFVSGDVLANQIGRFVGGKRQGLFAYLAGEPMRWITEDTVLGELQWYHRNTSLERRVSLLRDVGVTREANPEYLSYGQRKIVSLLSLPDILRVVCLDEPFADLSLPYIECVEQFINRQVVDEKWRAVVISQSSDVEEKC